MTETFAERFRPKTFDDVAGNQELIQTLKLLTDSRAQISLIFSGEPGTGKTTLAEIVANSWNEPDCVTKFNAAFESKAALREIIEISQKHAADGQPDVIIIDELHRLDKGKQDFLLPALEHNSIIMIGTTTENPSLAINPAIRSRTMTFEVTPPTFDDIQARLSSIFLTLTDQVRVSDHQQAVLTQITRQSHGDLRTALNLLQVAYQVDQTLLDPQIQPLIKHQNTYQFDRDGSHHYQAMAALQKSIRGSDVDASLYYLAVVLQAGDVESVVRRIRVIAYEDIGLADLQLATQTQVACDTALKVGMPEARIPLADAVIQLALADKSNLGMVAYDQAAEDAQHSEQYPVPAWINTEYPTDYQYPHSFHGHIVKQQYLPDQLKDQHYFGTTIKQDPDGGDCTSQQLSNYQDQYKRRNQQIGRD